jgi:serine phosphatase RsbU (regulator of sigma subunit)
VVAAALPAEQADLRDAVMLLVSELVTNAVVHAASAVELEVEVAEDAVTVRVRDADTGPLVMRPGGSELDEGGRGFLLVDRLADAWGTEHHAGRKTVWFRIGGQGTRTTDGTTDGEPVAAPALEPIGTPSLHRLLVSPAIAGTLSFDEHIGELLMRVNETVGGVGAEVTIAHGDTATISRGDLSAEPVAKCELAVDDHTLGSLTVHGNARLTENEAAFVALAADRITLLVAAQGFLHRDRSRASELDFLADATELLTRSLNVALTLALVTQLVVPRLGDWCAAYSVDDRGRPRRLTVNHRSEDRTDAVVDALEGDVELRAAIREAAAGGPPQRLPLVALVAGSRNHVTVVPLQSRGRTLGVLVAGHVRALDPVGYMAMLELARRAALAIDNARLHEDQSATVAALQASLLPPDLPDLETVRLAACYHSAAAGSAVGGDFYDAFSLPDGRLVLAIGDVCGKGAEAAAVTGMTRDLLRLLLQDGAGVAAALRRLNQAFTEHPTARGFCTVALATLAPDGQELAVRLCLAGHPEPVLLRADGSTEFVGTPGDLLGVLPDDALSLTEVDLRIAVGESLVFYTDGVTERREQRRMFGQHGVRQTLQRLANADARVIAEGLEAAARSFVPSELRDDLAILVAKNVGIS